MIRLTYNHLNPDGTDPHRVCSYFLGTIMTSTQVTTHFIKEVSLIMAHKKIMQYLQNAGFNCEAGELPSSCIGNSTSATHCVFHICIENSNCAIAGVHDYTQVDHKEGQEIEFCGIDWYIFSQNNKSISRGTYMNDYFHAVSKRGSYHNFVNALSGAVFKKPNEIWEKFCNAANSSVVLN